MTSQPCNRMGEAWQRDGPQSHVSAPIQSVASERPPKRQKNSYFEVMNSMITPCRASFQGYLPFGMKEWRDVFCMENVGEHIGAGFYWYIWNRKVYFDRQLLTFLNGRGSTYYSLRYEKGKRGQNRCFCAPCMTTVTIALHIMVVPANLRLVQFMDGIGNGLVHPNGDFPPFNFEMSKLH